jgi:hypothetical protein
MSSIARPDLIRRAICSGFGYGLVEWKPKCLERFLVDRTIPEKYRLDKAFRALLRKHVCEDGNQPEAHEETDPQWRHENPDDLWWYCVLISVPELHEGIYAKMKLLWEDGEPPDDAFAQLVSVHKGFV